MLKVKEAAALYSLTVPRLKQILTEEKLEVNRAKNGYITIPAETMNYLNALRGKKFDSKIITIATEKGGVGKSVLTIFTATYAARYGIKTLVIDCDPEMCASLFLTDDEAELRNGKSLYDGFQGDTPFVDLIQKSRFDYVDFIPSNPMVRRLERLIGNQNPKTLLKKKLFDILPQYDAIYFDLPPSFTTLCSSAYLTSDIIVMPVCPDIFSLESLYLTIEDIEAACAEFEVSPSPEIRIIKNRFTSDRKSAKAVTSELNREFSDTLLDFQIKSSADVSNALNDGKGVFEMRGNEELKRSFHDLSDYLFNLEV